MHVLHGMGARSFRKWVWASVVVQAVGYAIDIAWHALVSPGVEPATAAEMARHLATVHLPLYIGAACGLLSTGIALFRRDGRPSRRAAARAVFGGALLSAGSELVHAYSHLRLDTEHAFVPGILSAVGFLIVVVSLSVMSLGCRLHSGEIPCQR